MYEDSGIDEVSKDMMSILVRLIGLFLLLAGLWVAVMVLLEALELYREPQHIERFAKAIEQGSNIDKSLVSIRKQVEAEPEALDTTRLTELDEKNTSNDIRVSYFFAWVIALLLLLLIARISLSAVKTGGELVLYDLQIKKFAKILVKESSNPGR